MRLVGSSNQYEGRVEVCINDTWGTVCDDSWGSVDATVICKQLEYAYTGCTLINTITIISSDHDNITNYFIHYYIDGKYYTSAYFGAGSGTIWFDNVACTSSNTKLVQCSSSPIGEEDCSHSEDAGVGCEGVLLVIYTYIQFNTFVFICFIAPCDNGQLRLADGYIPNEGRVEICMSNEWGTVCDDYFTSVDAQVVCKKLGYLTTGIQAQYRLHT